MTDTEIKTNLEILRDTLAIQYMTHVFNGVENISIDCLIDETIQALEQEPNMTWVTGTDGAKIAFKDVPAWKVTKICEILGELQESEEIHCTCTDAEISKSFIEDVEAVKDLLPQESEG